MLHAACAPCDWAPPRGRRRAHLLARIRLQKGAPLLGARELAGRAPVAGEDRAHAVLQQRRQLLRAARVCGGAGIRQAGWGRSAAAAGTAAPGAAQRAIHRRHPPGANLAAEATSRFARLAGSRELGGARYSGRRSGVACWAATARGVDPPLSAPLPPWPGPPGRSHRPDSLHAARARPTGGRGAGRRAHGRARALGSAVARRARGSAQSRGAAALRPGNQLSAVRSGNRPSIIVTRHRGAQTGRAAGGGRPNNALIGSLAAAWRSPVASGPTKPGNTALDRLPRAHRRTEPAGCRQTPAGAWPARPEPP